MELDACFHGVDACIWHQAAEQYSRTAAASMACIFIICRTTDEEDKHARAAVPVPHSVLSLKLGGRTCQMLKVGGSRGSLLGRISMVLREKGSAAAAAAAAAQKAWCEYSQHSF
jgi:hypothetical protein